MQFDKCTILIGPPGTGKTASLLARLNQLSGDNYDDVAFISFTKKAINEVKQRINNTNKKHKLPFFRTLHSLCYLLTGVNKTQIITKKHYDEFTDIYGVNPMKSDLQKLYIHGHDLETEKLFFEDNLHRISKTPLENLTEEEKDFSNCYRLFKENRGLLDFTDIIERARKSRGMFKKFKYLFIDEAQDLSPLQWEIVSILIGNSEYVAIAGDDDQCIYSWAGADSKAFVDFYNNTDVYDPLKREWKKTILEISRRIPVPVYHLASNIINKINDKESRIQKSYKPKDGIGSVSYINCISEISLDKYLDSQRNLLILVRSNYQIEILENKLLSLGYYFNSKTTKKCQTLEFKFLNYIYTMKLNDWNLSDYCNKIFDKKFINLLDKRFFTKDELVKLESEKLSNSYISLDKTKIKESTIEYYQYLEDRGFDIPMLLIYGHNITISTIHSAKGGEADDVVLYGGTPRNILNKFYQGDTKILDDEIRLKYVGITRTKENLFIVDDDDYVFNMK